MYKEMIDRTAVAAAVKAPVDEAMRDILDEADPVIAIDRAIQCMYKVRDDIMLTRKFDVPDPHLGKDEGYNPERG